MARTRNKDACLICCFGVSRKDQYFPEKISSLNKEVAVDHHQYSSSRNKLITWSMFGMKNTSAKTVPLDQYISSSDQITDLSENSKNLLSSSNSSKPKSKIRKLLFRFCKNSSAKTTPYHEITEVTEQVSEHNPLEDRASLDNHRRDTSKSRRKIDGNRTGSRQPGFSPPPDAAVVKSKPKPARATTITTTTTTTNTSKAAAAAKLSHSVSMPVSTRDQKLVKTRAAAKKSRQDDGDRSGRSSSNVTVHRFDPVVGMSIIAVTLIMTLIWGRLCAILCTCAWLYFVSRLRSNKSCDDHDAAMRTNGGDLDLNSVEYKQRVVLEGFLERGHNHRIVS